MFGKENSAEHPCSCCGQMGCKENPPPGIEPGDMTATSILLLSPMQKQKCSNPIWAPKFFTIWIAGVRGELHLQAAKARWRFGGEAEGVMQNGCKRRVSEPDKIKLCLEQSGSQAGQERICLSCAFLTAFSEKEILWSGVTFASLQSPCI